MSLETAINAPAGEALGNSRDQLAGDAPVLLSLLDLAPNTLIHSRSSPQYDVARRYFNLNIKTNPLAVASPTTEADVSAIVRFCQSNKIPLCIRTGGHDFWYRSAVEDGVLIDMRAMNSIQIADDGRSVTVGGGILMGELNRLLDQHDRVTPMGFCNTVGYVGWACGGGYGVMQGKYGLGVDQILGARIVTATGEIVDTDTDKELLWAIRGAGNGTFGVVVALRTRIYPRPNFFAGFLGFPLHQADQIMTGFAQLYADGFLENMSGDMFAAGIPGLGSVFSFYFTWISDDGNFDEARKHLENLKGLGTVLMDTVAEVTPYAFATAMESANAVPRHYHFLSQTVAGYSTKLGKVFVENPTGNETSVLVLHNAHGAAVKANPDASFALRRSHLVLGIGGSVPVGTDLQGPEAKASVDWAEKVRSDIADAGIALEMGYGNFTGPEHMDTLKFYGEETTQRLKAVKRKYDPTNVFFKGYPRLA